VDIEVAHHVELGDRTPELRVDHLLESLQDLVAIRLHEVEGSAFLAGRRAAGDGEALAVTSDSTRWPLLEERAPFATADRGRSRSRSRPRSVWLLTGLAFLCGGLVSAAGFSIGWRHQAQRDNATQTALAAATARTHRLEQRITALQASLDGARGAATSAAAAEKALARAGTRAGADAAESSGEAASISTGANSVTTAATRLASELKTLDTYLTTTPSGQLDPGYIASQTAYLARQLARLQGDAGTLGNSVKSFEASLHKLRLDANGLKAG